MNPLARFNALLNNSSREILCMPLVFGYAAGLEGVELKTYLQNGECIARCQINAQKEFGYDAVFVYADNCLEAEAIGSQIHFPKNSYPYIASYLLKDFRKFRNMPIPDPHLAGRMPQLLQVARYLRSQVGNNIPIIGVLLGPMTIAGQLLGLEDLLFLLIDSPHEFANLINYTSQISLNYGLALIESGVHFPILLEPSASESVIPHEIFVKYLLPHINNIFQRFKAAGSLVSWLMITGNIKGILPYYSQCGTNIASIDYEVSLEEALDLAPELIFAGNIKPYSFVNRTPQEIIAQSKKLVNLGNRGKGFILSSGCEIPLDTKPENLFALVNAARSDGNE